MLTPISRLSIPLFLVLLSSTGLAAQEARQDSIPRELVLALLDFGPGPGGGSTDLRVGRTPDDYPAELIPPGARVLGSMVNFETNVTVFAVPEPPDSAVAGAEARLVAKGWTRPPARDFGPRGGFVSSFGGTNPQMPNILCRGPSHVFLTASFRRFGGSNLKVRLTQSARYSPCNPDQARSPIEDLPMPTLYAPGGVSLEPAGSSGGGSGSGGVYREIRARLSGRIKPSEITAHYAAQMIKDGWAPLSDGGSDMVAAQMYQRRDDKGRTLYATLIALAHPDGFEREVILRISRR